MATEMVETTTMETVEAAEVIISQTEITTIETIIIAIIDAIITEADVDVGVAAGIIIIIEVEDGTTIIDKIEHPETGFLPPTQLQLIPKKQC